MLDISGVFTAFPLVVGLCVMWLQFLSHYTILHVVTWSGPLRLTWDVLSSLPGGSPWRMRGTVARAENAKNKYGACRSWTHCLSSFCSFHIVCVFAIPRLNCCGG